MTPLTIAEARQPAFALLYIAKHQKYFEHQCLDVSFLPFSSGREALTAVLDGRADLATTYETPIVIRTIEGHKLSAITTLHESSRSTALVVRTDRQILRPGDVRGKTIGVPEKTNAEFFLQLFLESHAIGVDDVKIINIDPEHLQSAILEGKVDAVAAWQPFVFQIRSALGKNGASFHSPIYSEGSALVGTRDFVETRGPAVTAVLEAIEEATSFYKTNNEKALAVVVAELSDTVDKASIEYIWTLFRAKAGFSNVFLTILEQEEHWFARKFHMVRTLEFDVQNTIEIGYAKIVMPQYVTVH